MQLFFKLAANWRARADHLSEKYRDQTPLAAAAAKQAMETCAEELEDLCREVKATEWKKDT